MNKKLQPLKKSFETYIKLGFEYATLTKMDKRLVLVLKKISLIDNSILIMDDLFDKSEFRNGNKCLYLQKGLQEAIIQAELDKFKAIKQIQKLMGLAKTTSYFQKLVFEKLFEFFERIYQGEKLNLELCNSHDSFRTILRKYNLMIKLFTGGHIKSGLEIGQLIANKIPEENLSKIAEHAGVIRQIFDDFNDYFENHHEPFGDFLTKENRLPEIIFKKQKGDVIKAVSLINLKKYNEARELILNKQLRENLFKRCQKEYTKIKKLKSRFNKEILLEDFNKILTKSS